MGTNPQDINIVDDKYICPVCSLLLRDPLQFNTCGHRLCQSCLDMQNGAIVQCAQCQRETPRNQVVLDRGSEREMLSLPISCASCNWKGLLNNYQKHLDQSHPNLKYLCCSQQFSSINQLNEHKAYQCKEITVDCRLKDFGCRDQILRCEVSNHYLSKQYQDSVLNVIDQMKPQPRDAQIASTQMNTDHHQVITGIDFDHVLTELRELNETIVILRNGIEILNEDTQRHNTELIEQQIKLHNLMEKLLNVHSAVTREEASLEEIRSDGEVLKQELLSLTKKINEMQYVSYDGTSIWKIASVREKILDAQSERQTSIYSPPFYSSPTGYKMRARLYLHGDGNARRTHMSLFFVLMRGPNDAILKFPFNYKVTFCLYDQTPQVRHIIDSFRPDIKSNSFQRPRSEMNIASGIPKFFPLAMIQQEGNPYVRDDIMFIKVMVNIGDMPKTLLPYALTLNPGLPTQLQQVMIELEREKEASTSCQEMEISTYKLSIPETSVC